MFLKKVGCVQYTSTQKHKHWTHKASCIGNKEKHKSLKVQTSENDHCILH